MEKFYASKENCKTAQDALSQVAAWVGVHCHGTPFNPPMDQITFVRQFLEAAYKRLPMEASFKRSEQARAKRKRENAGAKS